ncbi:hypothetical protein BHE74_00010464 [Ensete ventricosum]|nr:hypothetical protein GW17_00018923 [Ensete ventricosum]RWW81153.1 hypothetical protein BHE74_00010464 [Ensete ventricosum]RZR90071.1 hypothetical protein BHM03_00017889 [Ensete ventricosum]
MPFWFPFPPSYCNQSTKGGNKLFGFPFPSPGSRSPSRFVFTVPTRFLRLFFFSGLGEERGTESKSYA